MEVPHESLNPLVVFVRDVLKELEDESNNGDVVKLRPYKKKALMFTFPNLPLATGTLFQTFAKVLFTMVSSMLKPQVYPPLETCWIPIKVTLLRVV